GQASGTGVDVARIVVIVPYQLVAVYLCVTRNHRRSDLRRRRIHACNQYGDRRLRAVRRIVVVRDMEAGRRDLAKDRAGRELSRARRNRDVLARTLAVRLGQDKAARVSGYVDRGHSRFSSEVETRRESAQLRPIRSGALPRLLLARAVDVSRREPLLALAVTEMRERHVHSRALALL